MGTRRSLKTAVAVAVNYKNFHLCRETNDDGCGLLVCEGGGVAGGGGISEDEDC